MTGNEAVRIAGDRPRAVARAGRIGGRSPSARRFLSCAVVVAAPLLGVFALAPATSAHAAVLYTVTTTSDEDNAGACTSAITSGAGPDSQLSLREAICEANNAGGAQTISVPAGTYNLGNVGTSELQVGSTSGANITFTGAGAASTIIHQTTAGQRVFDLDFNQNGNVTVNISGVTISGGTGTAFGGGGILAGWTGDNTTLDHVVITGNTTSGGHQGGGIGYGGGGNLTITNSDITNNSSDLIGGGIAFNQSGNAGNLTITNSTISGNSVTNATAPEGGGLLVTGNNTVTINSSTFTNNTLSGATAGNQQGGAIDLQGGTLNMSYSRIVGNSAGNGRGLYVLSGGATANATNNWWGCNGGPGATGCDDTQGGGTIQTSPYLKLTLTADATHINPNTSTDVHASTTINSNGVDTSGTGHLPDSPPTPNIVFAGTLGTVSPNPVALVGGHANSTYTAGASGGNGSASATLDNATATVNITINASTAPSITTNPANQTVCSGQTASFSAAASGNPTPTVQWQVSTDGGAHFTDIAGATSTTYSFMPNGGQNGNQYRAVFTNGAGSVTSSAATLTVNTAPSITTNPADQTTSAGQTVTFSAAANGRPTPTVQWQVSTDNGAIFTNISGATSTTLTLTNVSTTQNGNQYRAVFSGSCGMATTTAATLTVQTAQTSPSITTQPANQTVSAGQTASFSAAASGNPAPTVQWQVSTDNGGTFTDIAGATSTTYSFTAQTSDNGKQFRAVFTNAVGTATSTAATLTVTSGGGGGGGPAATPELGSGELLATGLLPLGLTLLYRRRRARRAARQ